MERDTEEWRRPWTSDDVSADAGSRRRIRRVVRPIPSTLQPPAAHEADDEQRRGRTVTVRSRSDVPADPTDLDRGDRGRIPPRAAAPGAAGAPLDPAAPHAPHAPHVPNGLHGPHAPDGPGGPGGPNGRDGRPERDEGRRTDGRRVPVAMVLVVAIVGGVAGAGATLAAVDRYDLLASDSPVQEDGRTSEDDPVRAPVVDSVAPADGQTVVAAVAAAVLPSVVRIDVLAAREDPDGDTFDIQVGIGSGVIYRSDGYLLTNNHVVRDADTLEVQFSDGTTAIADVIGTDRLTDLAVLKVERTGLAAVNLRQDRPLEVGETAVAIGSPFGLDASVTAGVVSALNRDLEVPGDGDGAFVIPALIQTDAAINPGNSGGALVDANGQLIGLNTAILTGSGGSQGVGFAIPTRSVVIAADQLIERGFVSHAFLGISGLDVTNEVEARYRDELDIELNGGALVDSVVTDSGADEGGVEAGDIIIEVEDEPIRSMTDVISAILRYDPGETIEVVVLRDGERLELEVELGERPR